MDGILAWVRWFVLFVLLCGIQVLINQVIGRLSRVERKVDALLRQFNIDPIPAISERVKALASEPGKKIAAIKAYREETGTSLSEAKAAVEEFIKRK